MTQQLELPGLATCGHPCGKRRCSKEPGHFGIHYADGLHWKKDAKWKPTRGRVKQDELGR